MDKSLQERLLNFIDNWENLDNSSQLESTNSICEIFENSSFKNNYGENVIDFVSFYFIVWNNLTPEIQELAQPEILQHIKNHILQGDIHFKSTDYDKSLIFSTHRNTLSQILCEQPENVKNEILGTLKEIIPIEKYPANKEYRNLFNNLLRDIWMDSSLDTQQQNLDFLDYLLPLSQEIHELELKRLDRTSISPEVYQKRVNELEENHNTRDIELLRNTRCKLTKELFQTFIERSKLNSDQSVDDLYPLYEQIFEYNTNINSTLYLQTLSTLGKDIDIMKLIRISSANISLQDHLIKLISSNDITKQIILNSINKSDYWDTELSAIDKNFSSFYSLFQNLSKQDFQLTNENIDSLTNIVLQKNYFNIQNIDDVENYENIKNSICRRILNGEKLEDQYKFINEMTKSDREKFAVLEMQFGISLEDAINLVEKYGTDINEISDSEFSNTISQIKSLKAILSSNNLSELYNTNNLESVFGKALCRPTTLENECLNLYAKLYRDDFEKHNISQNITSVSEVEYDNSTIKVHKLSPYKIINGQKRRSEFSAFARVEGAYANWKEPENFREALEAPNISYHGNCKSAIRSNSIGIAKPSGPTYGYTSCNPNTLKLMAPWDIVSSSGNQSFAINSLKWDQNVGLLSSSKISGIQFRTPQNTTDFTRHGHNEIVSERLVINGKKFEKDEPNFVLFLLEAGETTQDYETLLLSDDFEEKLRSAQKKEKDFTDEEYKILNANRWRISKKAAMQLNKDIYLIDRDEFRECEELRLNQLLDAFENPKKQIDFIEPNDESLSQTDLLERIIVEFENNVNGNMYSRNKGLFDEANRESLHNRLQETINSLKKSKPELYEELSQKLAETCQNEYRKSYSNLGKDVASPSFKEFYETKSLELGTKQEYLNESSIKTLESSEEGIQYSNKIRTTIEEINKTDLYEGNKAHSIEHIDKVILFAGLLAKNEGLDERTTSLLLTASAFHDAGRKIEKENYSRAGHAWESALVISRYLKQNPDNPFGITEENLGILQAAIEYHEIKEPSFGKINIDVIKRLCDNYDVKQEDFDTVVKISELLKDADALDRTRFSEHGKLDIRNLRSSTAKSPSMITYATKVNEAYAKSILSAEYDIDSETSNHQSYVSMLHNERESSKNSLATNHLPLSERLNIMETTLPYVPEPETSKSILSKIYNNFGVDNQSILQAKGFIKRTLDKIKTSFIERS